MVKLDDEQKHFVVSVCAVSICAGILLGVAASMLLEKPKPIPSWLEIVDIMPPKIKQDIAIDFCVAHKLMCRTMPLSSPINPMDGRTK